MAQMQSQNWPQGGSTRPCDRLWALHPLTALWRLREKVTEARLSPLGGILGQKQDLGPFALVALR